VSVQADRDHREQASQIVFQTALGPCAVRWSELGIAGVLLGPARARAAGSSRPSELPEAVAEAVAGIVALLDGEPRDLRATALDERGIEEFRRRVYAVTRAIGPGETASYGEIAKAVGAPAAAREVGAALGRNPFPIVVPCHRVLAADGSLRGFSAPGGIRTKRRMLEIEGAPGFAQRALFA
jgi:methylated-DNA-[protein]-cysteine S-methyltransferase